MGAQLSKTNVLGAGDGGRPQGTNGTHHESGTSNPPCHPCFFFPAPFRRASSHSSPGSGISGGGPGVSGNHKAPSASSSHHKSSDPMGTPMPDTPVYQRRKREALQQAMRDEAGGHTSNPLFSSKYGGLEKERDTTTDDPVSSSRHNNNGSATVVVDNTIIHDGPDCERLLHQKYQLLEVLGVGSTSTVHRCVSKATDQHCACKIIDCEQMEERFAGMMTQFQTEVEALQSLRHPGIIRLYDVYLTGTKIYIVMELMEGGELFDYVVQKGTLTEEEASRIVRKVTSAIAYMHKQSFIHRDLKPENLLLKHTPKGPYEDIDVKIIDFGLSKIMEEPVARTFLGTRGYLSPEQLSRRDYTKAVDSWALGVIVFVLLCGCLPFDDDSACISSDELVKARFQLRYPRWAKNLSPSAKDLLSHLLDVDPMRRYTAEEALDHPWVRGDTAPKENVLASPKQMKKSPAIRMGSVTKAGARFSGNAQPRRKAPADVKFSPPTPQGSMVRKTSI